MLLWYYIDMEHETSNQNQAVTRYSVCRAHLDGMPSGSWALHLSDKPVGIYQYRREANEAKQAAEAKATS